MALVRIQMLHSMRIGMASRDRRRTSTWHYAHHRSRLADLGHAWTYHSWVYLLPHCDHWLSTSWNSLSGRMMNHGLPSGRHWTRHSWVERLCYTRHHGCVGGGSVYLIAATVGLVGKELESDCRFAACGVCAISRETDVLMLFDASATVMNPEYPVP